MLGYDIEFGHTMVVSLINATKFEEKQVGYTATAVLLLAMPSAAIFIRSISVNAALVFEHSHHSSGARVDVQQ